MITTCMRNSIVGDAWIQQACALNPVAAKGDCTFLTGPVRIMRHDLLVAKGYKDKQTGEMKPPKFSVSLGFPPFADLREMQDDIYRLASSRWPGDCQNGQMFGIPTPIRDQGERANKEGYTPGLKFFNATSNNKPGVWVDGSPDSPLVTDPSRVYSGVWAIVSVRFYVPEGWKRVAAGLNGVVLYGNDTRLAGSGGVSEAQVKSQFSGVRMGTPVAVPSSMGQTMAAQPGYSAPMSNEDIIRQLMGN